MHRALPAAHKQKAQPSQAAPVSAAHVQMQAAASRILQLQSIVGNRAVQRMLAARTPDHTTEQPIQRHVNKDFKEFLEEKSLEPKQATKVLFQEYQQAFGQKIAHDMALLKEIGLPQEVIRANNKMGTIMKKEAPTETDWVEFVTCCATLIAELNGNLDWRENKDHEQSADSPLYTASTSSESAMLRANAGGEERPGWKAEWGSGPIAVDINSEAVPSNVKALVKFISDTNSAVGIAYKNPQGGALDANEKTLRIAPRVKADTRAPAKREYEKQHFGVMRSWHVDADGNLPDLDIENLDAAALSDKALDYLYHNAWDFNDRYSVTNKGESPEGIALPAYEKARVSAARPGMKTKDDMEAWYNAIAEKKAQTIVEEDKKPKKFAEKSWQTQNRKDKIKPQGYTEFNVKFGTNGRLVYDYINNEFYLTGHYQPYDCPKDVLKENETADGKKCHAFFKLTGAAALKLSEDETAEVQRLRYWENQRRDGLDTLVK
ncbi:hypothetical protein CBW65_01070 [Tumebacillus avium]|uniref:Uncharacterized protein n=2 Tax=Tumebacillus avium TaxID=1903704 RepID=A0A1Y0IH50_9BACL|nr:hypothetical protein CBW65_01070 [Tumebacillus avium]